MVREKRSGIVAFPHMARRHLWLAAMSTSLKSRAARGTNRSEQECGAASDGHAVASPEG
jgi:hypothetical protein